MWHLILGLECTLVISCMLFITFEQRNIWKGDRRARASVVSSEYGIKFRASTHAVWQLPGFLCPGAAEGQRKDLVKPWPLPARYVLPLSFLATVLHSPPLPFHAFYPVGPKGEVFWNSAQPTHLGVGYRADELHLKRTPCCSFLEGKNWSNNGYLLMLNKHIVYSFFNLRVHAFCSQNPNQEPLRTGLKHFLCANFGFWYYPRVI